jgi:hypothetical protein
VVAWHPSGAAGTIASWDADRGTALVLARARTATLRLSVDGSRRKAEGATVTLETVPPGLGPRIVARADRGGRVELPPAVLELYAGRAELREGKGSGERVTHAVALRGADLGGSKEEIELQPVP